MFGPIGAHFDILVVAGMALFACCLGYVSIADAIGRR